MKETKKWNTRKTDYLERMSAAESYINNGKVVAAEDATSVLEAVIQPFDRVNIEGNNQKQADFLAEALIKCDTQRVHDLHMVQSAVPLPVHLDMFEVGIAKKLDFAYGGPMGERVAEAIKGGKLELGAIHTYLELFARYFIDLTPRVSLICAYEGDADGNLYTGFNTEDTPVIVEATKFSQGIVIAQVNKLVDKVTRVDIPGEYVDMVIESPKPFFLEPLFTRDPANITDTQVLMAMMAIKGIYGEYGVKRLNHGIGFNTAAIELILPTYGEELGLKGKICTQFALNPHPTLIPAIESGWVESIYSFGGELGMQKYCEARGDVFFLSPDGTMRSNRAFSQTAGHYACDMFIAGPCKLTSMATAAQPQRAEWPVSVGHPIWVVTPKVVDIPVMHGSNVVRSSSPKMNTLAPCRVVSGWLSNFLKASGKRWSPHLLMNWMPGSWLKTPILICHRL